MNQAILLLLHNRVNKQNLKLINYFQGKCDIFIHIDKDCKLTKEDIKEIKKIPGVVNVYQKYHVHWAGFSILKTEMFLLKKALKLSNFKYIHLLSGNDYPIKPLSHFLNFFDNTEKEYIACRHLPDSKIDDNTFKRLQQIFLADYLVVKKDSDVSRIWKIANKLAQYGIRRKIPTQFPHLYCGSQWFSLSRKTIENMLNYTKRNSSFYNKMRFAYAAEEMYINTYVMNNTVKEKIGDGNFRYIHWPFVNAQHPATLTEHDFCDLASSDAIFARKIDMDKNPILVEKIDSMLLCERQTIFYSDGIREQKTIWNYSYDEGLLCAIAYVCKLLEIKDVVDLGCGPGYYVHNLRKENIISRGFDGNPNTRIISQTLYNTSLPCEQIRLHIPINSDEITDMVLLLNVGEYIPKKFFNIVIDNVCKLSKKYAIICWCDHKLLNLQKVKCKYDETKYVEDIKHIVNPLENEEITIAMEKRGYIKDLLVTDILRNSSILPNHKKNVICYRRSYIQN